MTSRLRTSSALVLALLLSSSAFAAPVQINFDQLAPGLLTDQLLDVGLSFRRGFFIKNDTISGHVIIPSAPNYLDLDHDVSSSVSTVDFVQPGNLNIPAVVSFVSITNLGENNFDGQGKFNGINFTALDGNGNIIDTATIAPLNRPDSRPASTIKLDGKGVGIRRILMVLTDTTDGGGALAPMDNWEIGELTVVPLPSAAWSGLLVLAGLGMVRMLRR